MKSKVFGKLLICAAVIITALSELPLAAEFVFLKDGSIIEGAIEADSAASVTLRSSDKKVKTILRKDIMRILYTKLNMGKIYIQKRDGKGVVAFIVDEDQESYTFRKELYSPEEFNLKRSEVLFMAEKNPSGLQVDGDVGTDRVSLTWLPPYDAVKKYNLYIKKKEKDKYELIDSTGSKSITLKKLLSNTTYFLIVTSVDSSDYESSPSNELKITTKNMPPEKPEILNVQKGNAGEVQINWKESQDPDGKVKSYRVYAKLEGKYSKAGETSSTAYTIPASVSYDALYLRAVDDRGDESEETAVRLYKSGFTLTLSPAFYYPMNKLSQLAEWGIGGTAFFSMNINNFSFGPEAGFIWFKGAVDSERPYLMTHTMYMVPMSIRGEYSFPLSYSFRIVPSVSAGFAYINLDQTAINRELEYPERKTIEFFDPLFKGGVMFKYVLNKNFAFSLGSEYCYIYETGGGLDFISFNGAVHYTF